MGPSNDSVCSCLREKLRRIFHWGPIIALFNIFFIASVSLSTSLRISPPSQSIMGFIQFLVIATLLYMILYSYFCAMFVGPGYVPLSWEPSDAQARKHLQFCRICNGYKPPRAHHCRTCGRCIMKMDHHCPWINACCGHLNHGYFLHFIHWAPIGCTLCAIMLASAVYHDWKSLPYVLLRRSSSQFMSALTNLLLNIFAFGLAVGVSLAVGTLAVYQLFALKKNQTAIESWIVAKANHWRSETGEKPFVYPYDLGSWNNLSQVLTWSGCAIGDGIHWPLRDGCGEYDLTVRFGCLLITYLSCFTDCMYCSYSYAFYTPFHVLGFATELICLLERMILNNSSEDNHWVYLHDFQCIHLSNILSIACSGRQLNENRTAVLVSWLKLSRSCSHIATNTETSTCRSLKSVVYLQPGGCQIWLFVPLSRTAFLVKFW
ncbi:hypothetical protein P879_07959 [Paragonimus westermani]|uniref:Palmitoyltransferase n=1 Tax=Paragonimus westermani TaxID=34504 RepID=A0A8T0DNT8_9TREM|nr:hypothetical protein P879_07959 [Paragonimus westermani]